MLTTDFEKKIQELDPRFTIEPNESRPGLSNIYFEGKNYDLPVVSSIEVKDVVDHGYRYEFPNGYSARHHTQDEVIGRLEVFLKQFGTPEFKEDYE